MDFLSEGLDFWFDLGSSCDRVGLLECIGSLLVGNFTALLLVGVIGITNLPLQGCQPLFQNSLLSHQITNEIQFLSFLFSSQHNLDHLSDYMSLMTKLFYFCSDMFVFCDNLMDLNQLLLGD